MIHRLLRLLGLLAICAGLTIGMVPIASAEPAPSTGLVGRATGSEAPLVAIPVPEVAQVSAGPWIRVNLSQFIAQAMVGSQVVHAAPITAGTPAWPTPTGSFQILRRVYSETMDSASIGIPPGAPGGYHLSGVLYTQYFTNSGNALHYNYWSPPSAFGHAAGSHGCVGLQLDDAAYFWNFATVGTPVVISY